MSDDALKKLIDGFKSFRKENYELHPDRMKELVENGQHPKTLVIACCDSRSGPETVLGADPGEIFVGRQIAALIPSHDDVDTDDAIAASIEYAVDALQVENIIVIGHSNCGGIDGLAKDFNDGAVGEWIQRGHEIKERVEKKHGTNLPHAELAEKMERESVLWSLENLREYPSVKKAMKEGRLQVHAWQFEMTHGELKAYNPQTQNFDVLAGDDDQNAKPPQHQRKRRNGGFNK